MSYEERLKEYKSYEDLSQEEFDKEYDYIMKCPFVLFHISVQKIKGSSIGNS